MIILIWLGNLILNRLHLEPGIGVKNLAHQNLGGLYIIELFLAQGFEIDLLLIHDYDRLVFLNLLAFP